MPLLPESGLNYLLSPAIPANDVFLRFLYSDLRAPEFACLGLSPAQVEAFCRMQYDCRAASHAQYMPALNTSIVWVDAYAVGRMDVQAAPKQWRLVNLELLTAWRGKGLGRRLLAGLQREAAEAGVPLALSADAAGWVAAWYRRCGFEWVASDGLVEHLVWRPAACVEMTNV